MFFSRGVWISIIQRPLIQTNFHVVHKKNNNTVALRISPPSRNSFHAILLLFHYTYTDGRFVFVPGTVSTGFIDINSSQHDILT